METQTQRQDAARLRIDTHIQPGAVSTLAADVRRGLTATPKRLPPKHLYDDEGSRLFDAICLTPEYYPTRTEHELLSRISDQLIARNRPTDIVELGSGMARKTRTLLDAARRAKHHCRYVPFDVSKSAIELSSKALLKEYPWLTIHGVVGDFDRHFDRIPVSERRLFLFLGGTIGNFEQADAVAFLKSVRDQMHDGDTFLLGTDLVKDKSVLDAAYNDAQGITAAFNKNMLRVVNRDLNADFDLDSFAHRAFFNTELSRIEMHLDATAAQSVQVRDLGLAVDFAAGESLMTEISRKFTEARVQQLLEAAGLKMFEFFQPENRYFGLSLSGVSPS